MIRPSDLLRMAKQGLIPDGPPAFDTETSGLFPDQGARVSTVSVAWVDAQHDGEWAWRDIAFPTAPAGDSRVQEESTSHIQTWDIEKIDHWDEEAVVSFAWPFDQGVEGTGKKEDRGAITLFPSTENLPRSEFEALLEWLKIVGEVNGLTAHHAKFDAQMARVGVRGWVESSFEGMFGYSVMDLIDWDTQNVADLLTSRYVIVKTNDGPRPSASLKPTAAYYWGAQETDEQDVIKRHLQRSKLPSGRWDLMPWDVICKYADQDARLTARLRMRQQIEIATLERELAQYDADSTTSAGRLNVKPGGLKRGVKKPALLGWLDGRDGRMTLAEAVERRLATSRMLYRVESRGLPFDVSASYRAADQIKDKVATLERTLPFKPATLPQAKEYFFGDGPNSLNHRHYATTPTGAPVMDVAVVKKMVLDGLPHAETWRDVQKLQTADSKWYTGWADMAGEDNRLRTSVRQNGTVSGRFSVQGVQLQAIPHDYKLGTFKILNGVTTPRELIGMGVPRGWELWELDLANAELRVAAMMAECKRMLYLIDQGADLHADACQELFNYGPGHALFGEYRQVAKRFNFSAIFGIGWEKLQFDIEQQTGIFMPEGQIKPLLRTWNATYPEYDRAIRATMDRIDERQRSPLNGAGYGWVTQPNGERRWFLPGEDLHKGFNQRVQPALAQFGLDWWIDIESEGRRLYGDERPDVGGVGVVLMVHDSVVMLVPEGDRTLVDYGVKAGEGLWAQRFPGVPGGVDASEWGAHS